MDGSDEPDHQDHYGQRLEHDGNGPGAGKIRERKRVRVPVAIFALGPSRSRLTPSSTTFTPRSGPVGSTSILHGSPG
jgi:hypothetical protein